MSTKPTVEARALIWKDNHLLIVRQFNDPDCEWELPGGVVGTGRDPATQLVALCREQLDAGVEVVGRMPPRQYVVGGRPFALHAFSCRIVSGEPRCVSFGEMQWLPRPRLIEFDFAHYITAYLGELLTAHALGK